MTEGVTEGVTEEVTEGVRGVLSDQVGFPDHCTAVQLR